MFRELLHIMLRLVGLGRPSAEEAITEYEAAHGHPHTKAESSRFEATSWLMASGRDPERALKRFNEAAGLPENDLDATTCDRIRSCLQRWARESPHSQFGTP